MEDHVFGRSRLFSVAGFASQEPMDFEETLNMVPWGVLGWFRDKFQASRAGEVKPSIWEDAKEV
ncbi:MAG: hypothetical protein JSV00_09060 [bacterium]|nr:MAG: hypothetical protein JSV00_09060 [bacterium]